MRLSQIFVVLALLFCILFVLTESKSKWKKKKYMMKKMKGKGGHHNKRGGGGGMGNNIGKHKMKKMMKKMKKMEGNDDWSSYHPRMMKKVSPKKHIAWLKLKSEKDCGLKCERGEVCIVGPVDAKLMCVSKKELKKSMKLFHKYQKKEKKAWKAFKIQHYNKAEEDDSAYFSKFDLKLAEEFGKPDMETEGHMTAEKKKHMGKDVSGVMKPHNAAKHHKGQECTPVQFSQMRKRMMGWFHLLHGQHHMSQSAQGERGNIKQFHKHNSIKKELREVDGNKCECAKSAMWQFHEMDNITDDQLTHEELAMMYENAAEPCLKPFFTSCDLNADQKLSRDEWCCCFSNIVAPCFSRLHQIQTDALSVPYVPRCDKEGYYRTEQCSQEKPVKCWCVDYNGNEYKDSTRLGRPHCGKLVQHGYEKKPEFP